MLKRRSFLVVCGSIMTSTTFSDANSTLPESRQIQFSSDNPATEPPTPPQSFEFRIEGWDSQEENESVTDGAIWIQINASWRSTWR